MLICVLCFVLLKISSEVLKEVSAIFLSLTLNAVFSDEIVIKRID